MFRRGVVRSRLQDVVDNISLAENNKCYAISFTRMEAVVALFSQSLCCQECQKGQSGHTSRGKCRMEELKL